MKDAAVVVITICPKPDPVFGHTFRIDWDLIDLRTGQITQVEYDRRQEAKRLARAGGAASPGE